MEIRLLGYVVAIAEEGSISAAARRMHLTQPTLSRQLRELERELGTRLFEREGRGLVPTEAGRALLRRARVILAEADAALADVRLAARGLSGRLTVAFGPSGINGPLGAALGRLHRELPGVELRLDESFSDADMSEGVLDGRYDLSVHRLPMRDPRLASRVWWREPMSLFVPENHALASGTGPLPLAALGRIPLVLWPREASARSHDEIIALCDRAGVAPVIAAEGRSVPTLLALVAAGFGGAVLADSMRSLRRAGVTARPLAGTTTVQHLVWRADDPNPLVERARTALTNLATPTASTGQPGAGDPAGSA
ncbi:LysR family transcriptional regulator [Actinomadura rupiterrae]|uniref:LysR family transcriptional regulator n=1 Tax=Actinomadura rupiterrae TaxID=559627 RepID=UPI0020A4FC93|nr:LysR family transcriptional regulator [Actinomadura rupiterrae]MCP2343042.1 DNA-binding transcriptional LysR family regulator [Actinomadura rupiterrae]